MEQIKLVIKSGKKCLVDLSFQIGKGEIVGLVGPSGAGKSLTARALAGILPSSLQVDLQMSQLKIGYVFQDPLTALNPLLTVGCQITEVTKDLNRTKELLRWLGFHDVETVLKQVPYQLSGGMRQRVVIAIALAAEPELLICDEATSSLDMVAQEQLLELLKRINREKQVSILLITHDWFNVLTICDRVLVMEKGRLVEEGSTQGIYASPKQPITKGLIEACNPL